MKKILLTVCVLLLLPVSAWAAATRPSLPSVYVTDTDNPPSVFAVTKTVCASGCDETSLQTAINKAILANLSTNYKIVVDNAYVVNECLVLASNNSTTPRTNTGWIYITTDEEANLPPRHVRLGCRAVAGCTAAQLAADDVKLFEIQYCGAVNGTAITSGWVSNNGPEYIWMRGFKVLLGTGVSANNHLISLSTQGGTEPTLVGQVASHIVFEQIHMESIAGQNARFSRGCWCNGYYIAVVDSVIGRFASPGGVDSQTIIMTKGGPLRVVNNDLFSASEVLAIGDSNPSLPVTGDSAFNEPHDIEIRYNTIGVKTADMTCPSYVDATVTRNANLPTGYDWPLKNLFEHKQAVREWLDSNYFYGYQNQYDQHWAFAFQNGSPDATIQPNGDATDITFTNNILYGYSALFQMLGSDFQVFSNKEQRVLVENNAFIDQRRSVWTRTANNCAAEDETRGSHQFLWANGYYTKFYSVLSTSGAGSTTLIADASSGFPMFYPNNATTGQVIAISGGTNFTAGNYTVATFIDAWHVTLTASPSPSGAGSGGVGVANIRSSVGGPDDLAFKHNLFYKMEWVTTGASPQGTGYLTYFDIGGWPSSPYPSSNRFDYMDNITAVGGYGFTSSVPAYLPSGGSNEFCTTILERMFPNTGNSYRVTGNVFVVDNTGRDFTLPGAPYCNTAVKGQWSGNYYPDAWSKVGFAYVPPDVTQIDSTFNLTTTATCTANADVSPMTMASGGMNTSGCASDGKNPGPDMNVLVHQVNFARMGVQPSAVTAIAATTGAGLSATAAKGGSGYAPNLLAH